MPLNKNYYCLLDDGVMESQAELAKKYGIYGFCYYHYWFKEGHKLLEKPLERMLHNPNVDIPFCLHWPNETWTRNTWDGGGNEIIAEIDYSDKDDLKRHVDYLCEFFADPRYIKEDGKPFFIIYKPNEIPEVDEKIQYIRERVKENGFPGIVIAADLPSFFDCMTGTCNELSVDTYIQRQPNFAKKIYNFKKKIHNSRRPSTAKYIVKQLLDSLGLLKTLQKMKGAMHKKKLTVYNYDEIWQINLKDIQADKMCIAGAFKDYDETPRRKDGSMFLGATPEKFREYMTRLVKKVREEYTRQYIFLNAWNEWSEGSYIEPDERYGYAWLEAIRDALNS